MTLMVHLPQSIVALVLYALWAIALVLMIAIERIVLVARGHVALKDITPGVPHGNPAYWRINRAHVNAVENLPIFAAIVLAGWAAGQESHLFNLLAMAVLVARIIQSLIHIVSGSTAAINARFAALGVQLLAEIWMAWLIFHGARTFVTLM